MARADILHPHGSDVEEFLYAFVGEDRDGFMVTVLSTLARLGLDPWNEASELADLSEEAAGARLGVLLAGFRDVPALTVETEPITRKLIALLPDRAMPRARSQAGSSQSKTPMGLGVWIFAIAFLVVMLARFYIPGADAGP